MAKSKYPDAYKIYETLYQIVKEIGYKGNSETPYNCYEDDKISIYDFSGWTVRIKTDPEQVVFKYNTQLQTKCERYNPGKWINYIDDLYTTKVVPIQQEREAKKLAEKQEMEKLNFGEIDDSELFGE